MTYRGDIDGLRGIAVLLVVLFHAGLPVSGGFIGVDIFFVISGYLITSIILNDLKHNKFSFILFYERRIRRILPALYVMMIVVMLGISFIQLPVDFVKSAKTVVFATLFSSNIFFWRTTNYFSSDTDYEFFLHTWSLGVEEQFYFLFPVVLVLLFSRYRLLIKIVVVAYITSLLVSVYATYYYEWAAYYLLPSRAWQMMSGALLALLPVQSLRLNNKVVNLAAISALLMLIVPALVYTKNTRFPGVAALVPTLGASLFILIGSLPEKNFGRLLLDVRWLRAIGLISYSLYLWHWPVFALIKNYQASVELGFTVSLLGIMVSFLLAYLSWRFVENPFRNKKLFSRKAIFYFAGVGSVLILLSCFVVVKFNGLPSRINPEVIRLGSFNLSSVFTDCFKKTNIDIKNSNVCLLGVEDKPKSVVLWGDSHAGSLRNAFDQALVGMNRAGAFLAKSGCPPLMDVVINGFTGCLHFNKESMKYILQDSSIEFVVMHARWALSVEGARFGGEKGRGYVLLDTVSGADDNAKVVQASMLRTVDQLLSAGKEVVIVSGVPEVGAPVPKVMANNLLWNKNKDVRPEYPVFSQRQSSTDSIIQLVVERYPSVKVVDPADVLCTDEICNVESGGNPLYLDDDHLSDSGASLVIGQLQAKIK